MPLDHGFQVEVLAHCAHREIDACLFRTTEKKLTVAQDAVAQGRRRLVQDEHIHVVGVQDVHQAADDLQARPKATVISGGAGQQHGHVHIGERAGPAASMGAE